MAAASASGFCLIAVAAPLLTLLIYFRAAAQAK
jgi:hypothetical protein